GRSPPPRRCTRARALDGPRRQRASHAPTSAAWSWRQRNAEEFSHSANTPEACGTLACPSPVRLGMGWALGVREGGVIGLGTMGAGIAEVCARAGLTVTAVEVDADALSAGMTILEGSLSRALSRGRLTQDEHEQIMGRVRPRPELASLAGADLVIEAVPEQLAIKSQVVTGLDKIVQPSAIIATNTSSLSVTAIAARSAHPGRIIGMHFFNPAQVMRLVEVVTTVLPDPSTAATVTALARRVGKTPVQVTDRAGFVANALLLPYVNHAVRLLDARAASRDDIDLAATAGIGMPM